MLQRQIAGSWNFCRRWLHEHALEQCIVKKARRLPSSAMKCSNGSSGWAVNSAWKAEPWQVRTSAHRWPRLMSTHFATKGSIGYASAATTVTLWSAKHTDRNASEPALISRTRYVFPASTVML